jgi:hypothetical protein
LAAQAKIIKYQFLVDRFLFVPVAIETMGVYGNEAAKFIAQLGERLNTVTCDARSSAFLRQRISVAIQRGNAAAILGTLPVGKGFGEIFNI